MSNSPTPEPEPEAPVSQEEQKVEEEPVAAEAQKEAEALIQSGMEFLSSKDISVELFHCIIRFSKCCHLKL